MNNVRHDELPLRSPPPRSESAARRHRGTAAANTTHRELSAFHANAATQRLIYDTPHGMHAAHAHARLTLRGGFERRCWAQAARRVSARLGASRWGRGHTCMRAAFSVQLMQPRAFRVQRQPQLIGSRTATGRYEPVEACSRRATRSAARARWRTSQQGGPVCVGEAEAEGGTMHG